MAKKILLKMKKENKILLLKAIISITLIIILINYTDVSKFPQIFKKTKLHILLIGFILLFFNTAISAYKWKILLESDNIKLSFPYLLQTYLIGTFFNLFLPTSIGGDTYRIYDIYKKSKNAAKSTASVFIDRASGFFALSFIGLIASAYIYKTINNAKLIILLLITFLAIIFTFVSIFSYKIQKIIIFLIKNFPFIINIENPVFLRFKNKIADFFQKTIESINTYKARKSTLSKILIISFLFQLTLITIVYLYSISLNYNLSFKWFFIFMPAIIILETIPTPTLYALGVRDAGYIFLFSYAGLNKTEALALSMTYFIMTAVYSSIGGIVFIFKKKTMEKKQ